MTTKKEEKVSYSSVTVIAFVGQEATQARHWIQSCILVGTDFCVSGYAGRFFISKTFTGQTDTHVASPEHFSKSTTTFGTIFTYQMIFLIQFTSNE